MAMIDLVENKPIEVILANHDYARYGSNRNPYGIKTKSYEIYERRMNEIYIKWRTDNEQP